MWFWNSRGGCGTAILMPHRWARALRKYITSFLYVSSLTVCRINNSTSDACQWILGLVLYLGRRVVISELLSLPGWLIYWMPWPVLTSHRAGYVMGLAGNKERGTSQTFTNNIKIRILVLWGFLPLVLATFRILNPLGLHSPAVNQPHLWAPTTSRVAWSWCHLLTSLYGHTTRLQTPWALKGSLTYL